MGKDGDVSIRIKKFLYNPLFARKQFMLDVKHPVRKGTIPKKEIKDKVREVFKVADPNTISVFSFKTAFGGGSSTGFGVIYDNVQAFKRSEPRYRLVRAGLLEKRKIGNKAKKEKKNKMKKLRGLAKCKKIQKK